MRALENERPKQKKKLEQWRFSLIELMIKRLNRNQTLVNFFTSVSFILILSLTPLLNYLIELCIHYSAIGTLKRLLTLDSGGIDASLGYKIQERKLHIRRDR